MKHWKKILTVLLAACLALTLVRVQPLSVAADESVAENAEDADRSAENVEENTAAEVAAENSEESLPDRGTEAEEDTVSGPEEGEAENPEEDAATDDWSAADPETDDSEEGNSGTENQEEETADAQDSEAEEGKSAEEIPEESAEESSEEDVLLGAAKGDTVTGTFPAVSGREIATVRYYTDEDRTEYAFAEFYFDEESGAYTYTFEAPYDGFTASETAENVRETYEGDATVIAEYFSITKWDGAVDVSWYDETSTEFYIDTPAKLAGVAAIVNGAVDVTTEDYWIRGDAALTVGNHVDDTALVAGATGSATLGLPEHDFHDRTIFLTADLDMGGADGSAINHYGYNETKNQYDYPNWMPIGGEYLSDVSDATTMVLSSFNGVLEGNGHYITNIYCYRYSYPGYQYAQGTGLVGSIGVLSAGEDAPSRMPAIRNLSLSGYIYGRRMVGGIVGLAGGGSNTHGTSAVNEVMLENLASHVYVYNTDSKGIGGVIGTSYIAGGSIISCYFDGKVFTTYGSPAGGIIGANEHMDIFGCYCRGTIDTGKNHYGRGIGGTGNSASGFTVDSCYYLKGCGDDPEYPGYYQYNLPDSISVNVTELTDAQMKDGTLLAGLNVNGTAYAAGADGYPVLYWETGAGGGALVITNPEGGTITASAEGALPNGTVVYLSTTADTGWNFRYYLLDGKAMTGDYVVINGTTNISAFMESSKAGVLKIAQNAYCEISVKKNGLALVDGELVSVTGADVNPGDSLYEGDRLMVTATLKEGVVPDDVSMDYSAAVGISNPFRYVFTYTGEEGAESSVRVHDVDARINGEDVSLTLDVIPLTTPKLWRYTGDTSWYDEDAETFTLTTAAELAGLDVLVESGEDFSGKTVLLGADISLTNTDGTSGIRSWDGIGNSNYAFSGTFDGQGHKITEYNGVEKGLFANTAGESTSERAVIRNVSVYGFGSGANSCGIAAESKYTLIENCSSYVVITGSSGYTGGILGHDANGTALRNCFNYGPVSGTGRVGGIAGNITATGTLTDCVNFGELSALTTGSNQIGGVAGDAYGAVTRCANYGDITAYGRNIGGLAAQATMATSVFTDCYNAGSVTYEKGANTLDSLGGLIGFGSRYELHNCFNYGTVTRVSGTMTGNVGALIGRHTTNSNSRLDTVYVLGTANADGYVIMKKTLDELKAANEAFYAGLLSADAEAFADAEQVLAAINGNESFVLTNGMYPELEAVAQAHVHTGGEATCSEQAVCAECGLHYGELNPDNHSGSELRNVKDAVWAYDGYTGDTYCPDCGELLAEGEVIPADTAREAVTFVIKEEGKEDISRTYTVGQIDLLKTTDPAVGYIQSLKTNTITAATEYITLQAVLTDLGVSQTLLESMKVICSGSTSVIDKDTINDCIWYFDEDGNRYSAPFAFVISQSTLSGSLATVAAVAQPSDSLRFCYGISQKQYDDKTEMGGKRLVSPVLTVELTMTAAAGGSVKGTVTGYTGEASLTLTPADEEGTSYETSGTGSYLFADVASGTYTLSVSGDGCVTHEYTVEVGNDEVTQDVELYLLGDVNRDGKVTTMDVVALAKHLAKIRTITDPYTLKLADVNGDGAITTKDQVRLSKYLSKIISSL